MGVGDDEKPHAVFMPFPAQSHMKGLMKLAKLLHHRGFFITFVNTEFNQNRFIKTVGPGSLSTLPDFQFKAIPDGIPPSDPDATQHPALLSGSVRRDLLPVFRKLLEELNDRSLSEKNPPVTCIVGDGVMPFTITAAQELGVPVAVLYTFPACAYMGFYQYRALLEKGYTPLKDASQQTEAYLETVIDWIPGMKNIRLKHLPTLFRTTDPDDETFNLAMEFPHKALEASALAISTFDALEPAVLDSISVMCPNVCTIGPLQLLLNNVIKDEEKDQVDSLGYSLWKEEPGCLEWLDSKERDSVVYVNFGSVTVMSQQQLVEFAWGLANSNHYFLWIIRPDLVTGESAMLPPEFVTSTEEKGFIAGWCPQEEVLNHPSVGGFLMHCGWNSTIESLSAGVPMMCWPFFADQPTICKYACTEWGVGMEIDNDVKREEIQIRVRELMTGEKGKTMKKKAMEWKELAEKATAPNGSSFMNFEKLVNVLLSKN